MGNTYDNIDARRRATFRTPVRRAASGAVAMVAMAGMLSACGSSSSGSGSASDATTSKSTSAATTTIRTPLGDVDVNRSYAPGVPSFADLYKSTETAPPSSSPPIAKGKSVVFMSCGQASAGCSTPAKDMAKVAELVGWRYSVVDGQQGANNGYQKAMEQAIAEKPDAIVMWGENCSDVKQSILTANAAGIKVIGAGASDCDDKFTPGGPQKPLFAGHVIFNPGARTIGELYAQIGEAQAAAVVNASQGKAKILRDVTDTISFLQWEQEGQDRMLKRCGGCKVLSDEKYSPGEVGPNGALFQKFTSDLTKYADANAAIFQFDALATTGGFSKAIVQAGRAGRMYTVAAEGLADGLALIRQGNQGLEAMPAYSADWIAWATVDEINRLFNRQPLVPEGVGVRLIDATHNMPPDGKDYQSPVDYASAYKKAWGLS